MHSQVLNAIQQSHLGGHVLTCQTLAHSVAHSSAFRGVDSASGVIATFPANSNGWVVAESEQSYWVKVSMHDA